jgi:hypothetical protein
LDETRKTAEHELAALRSREEYVRELEAGRDALLDSLEAQAPERLDSLTPEQRHQWYKLLKLKAAVFADGNVEVSWAGSASTVAVCETETLSPYCCQITDTGELRFRALLSESGVDRLELARCLP